MARRKKKAEPAPVTVGLKAALAGITKDFGEGSIMLLGTRGHVPTPYISTGALSLDISLGIGGVPQGRIVEIWGQESSGKTTTCLSIIAEAQKAGGMCAIVDVEHALDPVWATNIGCNVDHLLISQPDCAEDALEITERLVRSNEVSVVVVDSVAALVPHAEIEGQMGDSHIGLQARLMSQALRKLTAVVANSKTCLIFVNQIREKIGVMFGSPETTSGGNALKFYASVRIRISRGDSIKFPGSDTLVGTMVKYDIKKNKLAAPFRIGEFALLYDSGVSYEHTLVAAALDQEVLVKNGSWIAYGSDNIGQGAVQAADFFAEHPDVAAEVDHKTRVAAGLIEEDSSPEEPKTEEPKTEEPKADESVEGVPGDESK